jgi:hypothetical protein
MINAQQIKNITGHIGTGVGTAIVIFGLQAKGIDPAKATAAINALGDLVNNLVIVVGAIGAIVAAYKSVSGSSTSAVATQTAEAINANPAAVTAALSQETTRELTQAAVAVAANSRSANTALLESVTKLDNVQGVVVDRQTANATPNPLVTANPNEIPKAA